MMQQNPMQMQQLRPGPQMPGAQYMGAGQQGIIPQGCATYPYPAPGGPQSMPVPGAGATGPRYGGGAGYGGQAPRQGAPNFQQQQQQRPA